MYRKVMEEPLFDQLRTKEQLGYSVSCSPRVTCGVLGFCVSAQSAAYGPAHLYARVRAFTESFRDTLVSVNDQLQVHDEADSWLAYSTWRPPFLPAKLPL